MPFDALIFETNTTKKFLIEARELVASSWSQNCEKERVGNFIAQYFNPRPPYYSYCPIGAIKEVCEDSLERFKAYRQFQIAINNQDIQEWNDEEDRTKEHVLAAFDAAIAAA